MSRGFVPGCRLLMKHRVFQFNGQDWVHPDGSTLSGWQVEEMDSPNVTWPEPEPSVWESSVMDDGLVRYAEVPGTWEAGADVLVIRKDRVVSDRLASPTGPGTGYAVPGGSKARVIVVLEAE